MKKNLLIISAGAFGREVRDLAAGIQSQLGDDCPWRLSGFLDDRDLSLNGIQVLASPQTYRPQADDLFVCAIGNPLQRAKYAEPVRQRGGQFTVLEEPSSKIGGQTHLASGCVIGPFCVVSCNATLGEDTVLTVHATIGHDVQLGRCCHVGAYAFIGGGSSVGDYVTIHPHASILPGVHIGDEATIGAGAVVLRNVKAGSTVFGVPAVAVEGSKKE